MAWGKDFLGKVKMKIPKVKMPDVKKMTKGISKTVNGATEKVKKLNPFKK